VNPETPNPNRVLVIDDSEFIHELVRTRLREEGLHVEHELSGESGLAHAIDGTPDLILLDVGLPDVDGFEVCRQLKERAETRQIPVIFLTGEADTDAKVRGLDLGAVDYVTKPFDEVELRARVRAALRTKRLQDLLQQQSFLDGLTGLWNRSYLDHRLEGELNIARRYERRLSIVLGDIDHFKLVNDNYGHLFGDHVIQRVAEAIMRHARRSDIACRYGGEEFALLLPGTGIEEAGVVAERLRAAVDSERFDMRGTQVDVTISFGVASTEGLETLTPEAIMNRADKALYGAKEAGRNRVYVYVSDRPGLVRPYDFGT
jgi:two-component system cell cycle response regulator